MIGKRRATITTFPSPQPQFPGLGDSPGIADVLEEGGGLDFDGVVGAGVVVAVKGFAHGVGGVEGAVVGDVAAREDGVEAAAEWHGPGVRFERGGGGAEDGRRVGGAHALVVVRAGDGDDVVDFEEGLALFARVKTGEARELVVGLRDAADGVPLDAGQRDAGRCAQVRGGRGDFRARGRFFAIRAAHG